MMISEPGQELPRCDPELSSAQSPVPHDYARATDLGDDGFEHGSLAGGSYEILRCRSCHRIAYKPLPD